jgi:hypothetical protein
VNIEAITSCFYLSAVDEILKHATDRPSIGLILCKSEDNVLAEYVLRDMTNPIGLAEYQITFLCLIYLIHFFYSPCPISLFCRPKHF